MDVGVYLGLIAFSLHLLCFFRIRVFLLLNRLPPPHTQPVPLHGINAVFSKIAIITKKERLRMMAETLYC